MEIIFKKPFWFTAITTLCLVAVTFFAVNGCDKSDTSPKTCNNVSFTPCRQSEMRSSGEFSNKVDVEFTNNGVKITYYNFEVTCDFTSVNVTHTFVNGVLNITQQGAPNQANCMCYTDVSYTIEGISQNEVNVIFINGVQVYCHNDNYPIEIPFTEYSLAATSCQWTNFQDNQPSNNSIVIINSDEELKNHIVCAEGSHSVIDFSKYTLLLAHGVEGYANNPNRKRLQQFSAHNYVMTVNLCPNLAAVITYWQVPIIVSKITDDSIIELIVTRNP